MDIPVNPLEMKAEADPLEASFDSLLAAEEHEERIAALETGLDGVKSDVDAIRAESATMRERIERIARTGARPSLGSGEGKAPETKSFVDQYLRRGLETGIKSFTAATGADGGFAVPREIDALIARTLTDISPIRSIAQVVQTGTAGYRKLVTTGGTPSGWVSETAARPETDTPSFAEIAPPSGELYANPAASQAMITMLFEQFPGFKEVRMVEIRPGIAFVEFGNEMESSVALDGLQGFKITPECSMRVSYAKK